MDPVKKGVLDCRCDQGDALWLSLHQGALLRENQDGEWTQWPAQAGCRTEAMLG